MRRLFGYTVTLLSFFLLVSCNQEDPAGQPIKYKIAKRADSLIIQPVNPDSSAKDAVYVSDGSNDFVDSMMKMAYTLPPLLDETAYDTATVNSFTRMANATNGEMKLVVSADLIQENINKILCNNSTDNADILFLIDNTGSMYDDIAVVKAGVSQIKDISKEKKGIRLAVAIYRDKQYDSTNWFSFSNFEHDYDSAKRYINAMQVISNNDLPESVYEAFMAVADHKFWQSRTKRFTIIIGDARGKTKAEGAQYDFEDVIAKANASRIKVNLFPIIITPYAEKYRVLDKNPQPATTTPLISKVYPNPASGYLYIRFNKEERYRVELFNAAGARIEQQYVDGDMWMVDVSNQPNGLYVIRVSDKNNQYDATKFVVQH